MKKITIILLSITLITCKKSPEEKTNTNKTSTTTSTEKTINGNEASKSADTTAIYLKEDGKYYFHYQLEKGKTYPYYVNEVQTQTGSMGGKSQTMSNNNWDKLEFTVNDIVDNKYAISVKMVQKKSMVKMDNQTISMDSNGAMPKGPEKIMWKVNKALIGTPFTLMMDKEGNLSDIKGMNQMIEKAKQAVKGDLPADQLKALGEQLASSQNPESFKLNFQNSQVRLPSTGVKIGESWSKEDVLSKKDNIKIKTTYTLQSVENGLAKVQIAGTVPAVDQSQKAEGGVTIRLKSNGSQGGVAYIDANTGWLSKADFQVNNTQTKSASNGKETQTLTEKINLHTLINQ